jgi:triosephosphate isomerase
MATTYIVGNWKMNQTLGEIETFFQTLKEQKFKNKNCWIAPQALHLGHCLELAKGTEVQVGAQNISENNFGAFTGEIAAHSVKELGATFTLVGHSERRTIFKETDALLNAKTKKALAENLKVIFCIGETLEERQANKTFDVLKNQIRLGLSDIPFSENIIIAYEPVWAIGTGKTATPEMAAEAHNFIRQELIALYGDNGNGTSILYGGSVKPSNINELLAMKDINGALVGGASLAAESFTALAQ